MPGPFDINEIMDKRGKAVAASLKPITLEELKALGGKLFPVVDHVWHDPYFKFLEEHAAETFYHAAAGEGIEIIYCPSAEKGIWYVPGQGLGILQDRGIKIFKDALAKH